MSLFLPPVVRATDANANALSGAKRYFYVSGGLDPATTYRTAELSPGQVHDHPVVADSGGLFAPIYLDPSINYRVIERKANGDLIQDIDPYTNSLVETVGLKTELDLPNISSSTLRIRTLGYARAGWGDAIYVHDPSASHDAAYHAAHPITSILAADGRAFALAEAEWRPPMFGAVGVWPGDGDDDMADDYTALQAFFDHSFDPANKQGRGNLEGEWATSQGLYAVYPVLSGGSLEYHVQRRFKGGKIRALPIDRQPGGVPMDYILTIGGHHQHWDGLLALSGFNENGQQPAWVDMRAKNGIRLFFATQSLFSKVVIEGVKRDGVYYDPSDDPVTFRDGTDFEVTYNYSNNIGVRFDHLFVRNFGTGSSAAGKISKNWTVKAHGGLDGSGNFDPTPASYTGSTAQRTKLTFDTTEDFRKYDIGKFRLEVLPATYTTVTASAAAGTLTWAAGDPVAAGFVVGDIVTPQSGANSGKRLEIISFGGTSNRTITVSSALEVDMGSPGLVDEAATAITGFHTRWTPYLVTDVLSATEVLVWPWMEDRAGATGKWTFAYGFAANVTGSNTTTASFGNLTGLNGGGALNAQALYAPRVGSLRAEAVEVGVLQGYGYSSSSLGLVVDYIHAELCEFNIIQVTAGNSVSANVKGRSNLFRGRIWTMNSKTAAGDALMPARSLNFFTLDLGGEIIRNRQERSFSGTAASAITISNRDRQNDFYKAKNGPVTVTIEFDFQGGRLAGNYHFAKIFWIGPGGAAPTGDMMFALSADLTLRGFTIVGTNPVSGPAKPCWLLIGIYTEDKKVFLTRFDAV